MRIGTLPSRRRTAALSTSALLALAVVYASCGQEAPSGPSDPSQPAFKGKPPPDPVQIDVDDFNPKEGAQGETLSMTVTGSGFERGAEVIFVLDGEDVSTIATTTRSVDNTGTNLKAEVAIGLDAAVSDDYEVAVQLRGSRGVGTERFRVKVKQRDPRFRGDPLDVEIHDGLGLLHSDGQGLYVDGADTNGDLAEDLFVILLGDTGNLRLWMYESDRTYHVHLADGDVGGVCGTHDASGEPVVCPPDGNMGYGYLTTIAGTLGTMSDGETRAMGFGAIGMPTGRLTWGQRCDNKPVPADYVDVTAFDDDGNGAVDRWTIEALSDPAGNSILCRCAPRGNKEDTCTVGRFNVPFKLTLCRQGSVCASP